MAHAPSGKTRRHKLSDELNLVPMIDMVTNLMFFLMMFASVMPVVVIDAPLPKVAQTADEVRKAKDAENKLEIVLNVSNKGFTVVSDFAGSRSIPATADGKMPYADLHTHLVTLHEKRPAIKEITLMPSDDVIYDVLIGVMDAARELTPGDPGYQTVPPDIAQKPERMQFNQLFPEVSIGGV